MDDPLGNSGIDGGNRLWIELFGELLVSCAHSGEEFLDLSLEGRFDGLVLSRLFFGDQNTLFCGFDVGHGNYSFDFILE